MMRNYFWFILVAIVPPSMALGDLSLTSGRTVQVRSVAADSWFADSAQSDTLQAASAQFQARNLAECEKLLTLARSLDPGLPSVPILVARMFMLNGNSAESIARLENYLVAAPKDPIAFITFAEVALKSGRWTDAWLQLEHAEQLLMVSPVVDKKQNDQLAAVLLGLKGEVAANRRQWTEAEALFSKWALAKPKLATPIWSIGKLKLLVGEVDLAIENFKAARALDASLPQPELVVAIHLAANSDSTACEKWFRDGVKAPDCSIENWVSYLRWLLSKDRSEDIEKIVPKLSENFRGARDVRFLQAIANRILGKSSESEKIFSELHQMNPGDAEVTDQLALVLVESADEGKRARAQQLSEANLRMAPNSETVVATAAWVQYRLGSVDVADRMLGELSSKVALSPQSAYYVAQLLKSKGKVAEAKSVLEAALKSPGIFVQRSKVKAELENQLQTNKE